MQAILDSLAFNIPIFFAQVVLFVVLLIAMNALYWQPMLAFLRGRDQQIADAYTTVGQTRHEMEQLRADYQTRIAAIEAEARARIQSAIKEAQTERERLIAETRAQSEASIKQGIADMEREKSEALLALREQMVGMALTAAGKALHSAGDATTLQRTVEESVARGSASAARN